MALATFAGANWDNGAVYMNARYDTGTLKLMAIAYQNLSDRAAQVTVNGPASFTQTWAIPANTAPTSLDVSGANMQLVSHTWTNSKTGLLVTTVSLPAGWSTSFNWPI